MLVLLQGERACLDLGQSVSAATTPRLKVSREGIVLIKSFEGLRPRAVRDEDGRWVIGYGHTASAREGLTVGEQDAELLLQYDLMPVVKALNDVVSAPLNQHQFDALASFAISVGVDRFLSSDVLQRLNEGQAGQAADALIGWPETAAPDASLRRRAAERALFVADPASPVHLADLLAAPLPPPPVEDTPPPVTRPDFTAAVAALLGEDETGSPVTPAFVSPEALAAAHLQRYSPYSATVVGPLPGFPTAAPVDAPVEPVSEPEAPASDETGPVTPVLATPIPETPEPIVAEAEAAEPSVPVDEPAPAADPLDTTPEPETTLVEAPQAEPARDPDPQPAPEFRPVTPLVSAPPTASPFPSLDPLVLTAPTEDDFVEIVRPTWSPDQRGEASAGEAETVLFEDEPPLSVLRHEVEPDQPRRFDWSETGAYLIMGGLGLASCAFSAAAFRLSVEQPSPMGETTVIAWALALIGMICVGVSSWNLYVRWGKND